MYITWVIHVITKFNGFCVSYILMGSKEQDDFCLFVFDWNDIKQTPKWGVVLLVQNYFHLELALEFQGFLDLSLLLFRRVRPVKEFTSTSLLHNMSSGVTRELAESIGAVNDGVRSNLGISQDKVGICKFNKTKNIYYITWDMRLFHPIHIIIKQDTLRLRIVPTWRETHFSSAKLQPYFSL